MQTNQHKLFWHDRSTSLLLFDNHVTLPPESIVGEVGSKAFAQQLNQWLISLKIDKIQLSC